MRRRFVWIAAAVVVVLGLAAFVGWWTLLRSEAPPEATVRTDDDGPTEALPEGATPDGSWVVDPGDDVFVGYRIEELFGGDTLKREVAGRTPAVEGTMTIADTTVETVDITADVTQLASDQGRRDRYLKSNALETDSFSDARFVLTDPIDFGDAPEPDEVLGFDAIGDLTLHGVTNSVTIALEARWDGETIKVAGKAPIVLADFDIAAPDIAGLATADEEGFWEVQLTFARAT